MTQDEIIEMARKSGALDFYEINAGVDGDEDALIAFAKLVAAKAFPDGVDAEWIARRTKYAVEQEREACAKLVESLPPVGIYRQIERATFKDAATAIRARGEA